jgi:hypothetical protein
MSVNSQNQPPAGTAYLAGISGTRLMAALATMFNVLALNLALLIASLPLVTLPVAINAATVALDRWRREGEDSVVREFVIALRSRSPLRTTILVGVPLVAAATGVAEVHHFIRGGSLTDRVYLGLGFGALLITLTAIGYVVLLTARGPALSPAELSPAELSPAELSPAELSPAELSPAELSPAELWSLCAGLAIRNLLVTGPLFLIEIAGATVLTLIDPALLLLGVPLLLLQLMRLTAQFGLRRAEPGKPR